MLDVDYMELKRVRYNFWDVLGDVGGFHDGLVLLIRAFIGSFAAHGFFIDLIKNLRHEPSQSQRR